MNDPAQDRGTSRIRLAAEGPVLTVTLARPEVRNAFDETLLAELATAAWRVAADETVRVVVLAAEGPAFCAGADLDWRRRMAGFSFAENLEDARGLAGCLRALYELPQPLVGRVQGAAIGGAMGLVALCDLVVAADDALFGFSEVRLGLAPACICPYVVRRVGPGPCAELFLTGERFGAQRARELGLVQRLVPAARLDEEVAAVVRRLLSSGPRAMAACKELLRRVPGMEIDRAGAHTAEVIARLRAGEEGREGVRAFLERRRPAWAAGELTGPAGGDSAVPGRGKG